MKRLLSKFKIEVNSNIYLKDPESSDLGKNILAESINMIHDNGFEDFTFRKLGQKIHSTETSVYRYFENKHKLLVYLTCWYWAWLEYRLVFELANISTPLERMKRAIAVITSSVDEDFQHPYLDFKKLHHIIVSDSAKILLSLKAEKDKPEGIFEGYIQLFERIESIIREINPDYKYPKMLISTVIEGEHFQQYFKEQIPALSDGGKNESTIIDFYTELVLRAISKS